MNMASNNYKNMNVNPCKMCMPMGGALALNGIERSMILIHGSQGCSTYIRRHIAAHYNEPVDIASSSLTEEGTVYGGGTHLKKGLSNLIKLYEPNVIGVLTTCLAETIGEDVQGIIREYVRETRLDDVSIIPVPTPGYQDSHYEGYFFTLRKILEEIVEERIENDYINIVVSDITCEDIREIKRILALYGVKGIIYPDISETLDAPYSPDYKKLSDKGTKIEDIKKMGGAKATIEFSKLIKGSFSPGKYLENSYQVPLYSIPIPIGLENTDVFVKTLSKVTNKPIPEELKEERGRMLDAMIDSHKYNGEGIAAIYGTPDLTYALSSLCIENGIKPKLVMIGSWCEGFDKAINYKAKDFDIKPIIINGSDFETLQSLVKDNYVNLLIGHSDGKFIREKESVDLIRIGFPIHDHIGAQRALNISYKGSLRFLDEITNTLLDLKHYSYKERMYNSFYIPLKEKQILT
ncbi:MAG: nitrogenase component 1 [Eubacteriales bacterium]